MNHFYHNVCNICIFVNERLLQVLIMESQTTCAICGKNAIHKCSACGNVYYCSKQHQKEDWRNHAKACKSFKVSSFRTNLIFSSL